MHKTGTLGERRADWRNRHPKSVLYERVYVPLTAKWFAALTAAPERHQILAESAQVGVIESLERLNALFHKLVPDCLDGLGDRADDLAAIVYGLRSTVLWVREGPVPDPTLPEVREALIAKLCRNVSLGGVEATLYLESAYRFARGELGLTGSTLGNLLRRSDQLHASLATLHDEQERERLAFLTGRDDDLYYPTVGYADIIEQRVTIPADKFLVSGRPGAQRLRFVSHSAPQIELASPTMRCPAHREGDGAVNGTLNGALWDLLINLYERSGRFDRDAP